LITSVLNTREGVFMATRTRRRLLGIVSLAAALTLFGCGGPEEIEGGAGQGQERTTTIDFSFEWTCEGDWVPMFLANERGWFAEKGLKVNHVRGQGGSATTPLVASGERDIASLSAPPVILGAGQDYPLTVVGVASTESPVYLLAEEDIKQPRDLYGKRVGVQIEQFEGAVWKAFLAATQLDESRIDVVPTKPGQEGLFIDQRLDALVMFYLDPLTVEVLAKHPGTESVLPMQRWVPTYGHTMVVNNDFLNENPEAVRAFLEVWARGMKFVSDNHDEAVQILERQCRELSHEAAQFEIDVFVDAWLGDYQREHGLLTFDPQGLERTKRVLVQGDLMEDVDISDHYTTEYLPKTPVLP
jgi:NitT/TauT family transport system substrate-binding protein